MLAPYIETLSQFKDLEPSDIRCVVGALISDTVQPEVKADFLGALNAKGESPAEIAEFARVLREHSLELPVEAGLRREVILDVCGTGGDQLGTFNISTTAALVCAAAGVHVAKHGNRAITSQAGSADVLEALGISIELEPQKAADMLREEGFVFLFAPKYHPAFRHLASARKLCAARGHRTLFNFLGPLLNPARPSAQLVGVSRPELVVTLADTLGKMGVYRGLVVSGSVPGGRALDEFSTLGNNQIAEFLQGQALISYDWSPNDLPLNPATLEDLNGGTREENAMLIERLFAGEDTGPKRDAVLLNAGAALMVAGRATSIAEGWDLALETLVSGKACAKLAALRRWTR